MAMNRYGQPIGEPMPDWQPARRPGGATLGGRFCSLAPLEPQRDYAALFEAFQLASDGRDWTYLSIERPDTPAAMLQHLETLQANPTLVNLTVSRSSASTCRPLSVNSIPIMAPVQPKPTITTSTGGFFIVLMIMHSFCWRY